MNSPDPRHDRLLRVGSKVVGVLPTSQSAPLVQSAIRVAAAMSTLSARAGEIRAASQLLDSERTQRLSALQAPAVQAARDHLATVAAEKRRIEGVRASAFPVQRGDQVSFHRALMDAALVQRLAALDPSKRNIAISRAAADPAAHPDLTGAVLRAGREVIDLPDGTWDALHAAAMAAWRPDELAHLDALTDQLELAEHAAEVAEEVLREALPGAVAALKAPLPEAPPVTLQPGGMSAADRQAVFDSLPEHVKADLRNGGRMPGLAELRAMGGTQ